MTTETSQTFSPAAYVPKDLYNQIVDVRVQRPELIAKRAETRKRRLKLAPDGKLVIIAADHPARGVLNVGENALAMGNRHEYLSRIIRAATAPDIDGIMATPDLIDELLILDALLIEQGGRSFLDDKVILGCMNRGGLRGAAWELDDFFSAYTAESLAALNLDGAKLMFRLDYTEPAAGHTIEYCADAIKDLNALGLPAFLEPLPAEKTTKGVRVITATSDLIHITGIASALGDGSQNLWLKLPACDDFAAVAAATTCPILLLGGESREDPSNTLREFAKTMQLAPNVRGALVGRNILFPGKNRDPYAAAEAVGKIVHRSAAAESVVELANSTGTDLDRFAI